MNKIKFIHRSTAAILEHFESTLELSLIINIIPINDRYLYPISTLVLIEFWQFALCQKWRTKFHPSSDTHTLYIQNRSIDSVICKPALSQNNVSLLRKSWETLEGKKEDRRQINQFPPRRNEPSCVYVTTLIAQV